MSESVSVSADRQPDAAATLPVNDNARLRVLDGVRATINYLERSGERPRAYQYDPPPGVPLRTGTYTPTPVLVRNGRAHQGQLSLDREGFLLTRAPTAFANFTDSEAVETMMR